MKCSCVLPVHLLKCFENGNVKEKLLRPMRCCHCDPMRRRQVVKNTKLGHLKKKSIT